jgi:hypothetical protein
LEQEVRPEIKVMVQHQLQGQIQFFQQLHQQVVVGEQEDHLELFLLDQEDQEVEEQ